VSRFSKQKLGMLGMASGRSDVFQDPKFSGECNVCRGRNILVTEKQYLVLEQQSADLGEQIAVFYCVFYRHV
jgi:hypothetical protein